MTNARFRYEKQTNDIWSLHSLWRFRWMMFLRTWQSVVPFTNRQVSSSPSPAAYSSSPFFFIFFFFFFFFFLHEHHVLWSPFRCSEVSLAFPLSFKSSCMSLSSGFMCIWCHYAFFAQVKTYSRNCVHSSVKHLDGYWLNLVLRSN